MRSLCILIYLCISALVFSTVSPAQDVELDVSACYGMYDVLVAMKNGRSKVEVSAMLDSVLDTRPYKTMFRHYNRPFRPNHLPIAIFKRMIVSLQFTGEYVHGENQRADQMLPFWTQFYNDLPLFQKNLQQLRNVQLTTLINEGVSYAQTWLPPGWHIPDFYFFIHPNGGSGAFAIDGSQGYDFFRLPRDSSGNINWNELVGTISHESHHLGMKGSYPGPMTLSDSIAYDFLSMFVGEGTATKFVDNAQGGCVPAVDEARTSGGHAFGGKGIDSLWKVYTLDDANLFKRMIETFEKAYSGYLTHKQLAAEMNNYWLSGLKGPVYFVGSELFGSIYHAFGKDRSFAVMKDPRQIFELYNNAIKTKPELLGTCYLIPDSIVRHALAIGQLKK